ncbi:GNAT family N-acetyltransferase [bacterium]|nr:GNAT family N-acetyltransferase [bacterium]
MTLSEIRDSEILHVLHETYELWSTGLTKADYYQYNCFQRNHDWGRRHLKFLALKHGGEIAVGCKAYQIEISSRGKNYQFLGIGALFSRRKFRGQGLGARFMEEFIDRAENIGAAGILLFSDIGSEFYEQFGFQELSSLDFAIDLALAQWRLPDRTSCAAFTIEELGHEHIEVLHRYHQRWLSRRPFAVRRSAKYWHYKIAKELFLHQNSTLAWPRLQLLKADNGYCIYEVGGKTMRILELVDGGIGPENIWRAILTQANALQIRKIRGWEGNLRGLEPGFNFKSFLAGDNFQADFRGQIYYSERNWGRSMMLSLDNKVDDWLYQFPCPLMELDHL